MSAMNPSNSYDVVVVTIHLNPQMLNLALGEGSVTKVIISSSGNHECL